RGGDRGMIFQRHVDTPHSNHPPGMPRQWDVRIVPVNKAAVGLVQRLPVDPYVVDGKWLDQKPSFHRRGYQKWLEWFYPFACNYSPLRKEYYARPFCG